MSQYSSCVFHGRSKTFVNHSDSVLDRRYKTAENCGTPFSTGVCAENQTSQDIRVVVVFLGGQGITPESFSSNLFSSCVFDVKACSVVNVFYLVLTNGSTRGQYWTALLNEQYIVHSRLNIFPM